MAPLQTEGVLSGGGGGGADAVTDAATIDASEAAAPPLVFDNLHLHQVVEERHTIYFIVRFAVG